MKLTGLLPKRKRSAMFLAAVLVGGVFLAWLLYPPFPPVDAFAHRSYSSLVNELGPPTGELPDKFVQWSVRRAGVVDWFVEAAVEFPIVAEAEPSQVSRQLWVAFPDGWRRVYGQFLDNRQ